MVTPTPHQPESTSQYTSVTPEPSLKPKEGVEQSGEIRGQSVTPPPLPAKLDRASEKTSSVTHNPLNEAGDSSQNPSLQTLFSRLAIISAYPSFIKKLVAAQVGINNAKKEAKEFILNIPKEAESHLKAASQEIHEAGTFVKDTIKDNFPGLNTPEKRDEAQKRLVELKQSAEDTIKTAGSEAYKKVLEARQAWRDLYRGAEGIAHRIQTTVAESPVFQRAQSAAREGKDTLMDAVPKTDKQKFETYSTEINSNLEIYKKHLDNKEWKEAYKTRKKLEKADKNLDLLIGNQSKTFRFNNLESEIKKLREKESYKSFIDQKQIFTSQSLEKIVSSLGEANTDILTLRTTNLDPKVFEATAKTLETRKALLWESLMHQVESTGIYPNQTHPIALSEELKKELTSSQSELLEVQAQIAALTAPRDSNMLTEYSQRLETVLTTLSQVAYTPNADKRALSQDLSRVRTAVAALTREAAFQKISQEDAIHQLHQMENMLTSIKKESSKIISFNEEDPTTFKFINPNPILPTKNQEPHPVVEEILVRIEQLAGTPYGKEQALATLKALKENPVTGPIVEMDTFKTRLNTIENLASMANMDQFQAHLFGAPDNELQNQFLLAYRTFIGSSFFPSQETQPSAKLFEWLNNVFIDPKTSVHQKAQILEIAKKWAASHLINEDDYKIDSVKTQVDKLLSSASGTLYPDLQKTAGEIQKLLSVTHAKSIPPRDGEIDLASIIGKLNSLTDEEYQQAVKQVSHDLTAYATSLYSNVRPSELANGLWEKSPEQTPNLQELVKYSNQLTYYTRSIILEQSNQNDALKAILFFRDIQNALIDKEKANPDRPMDFLSALAIETALTAGPIDTLQTRLKDHPMLKDKGPINSLPIFSIEGNYAVLGNFMQDDKAPMVPTLTRSMTQIIGSKEAQSTVAAKDGNLEINLHKLSVTAEINNIFRHQKNILVQKTPLNTNLSTTLIAFQKNVLNENPDPTQLHYKRLDILAPRKSSPPNTA